MVLGHCAACHRRARDEGALQTRPHNQPRYQLGCDPSDARRHGEGTLGLAQPGAIDIRPTPHSALAVPNDLGRSGASKHCERDTVCTAVYSGIVYG